MTAIHVYSEIMIKIYHSQEAWTQDYEVIWEEVQEHVYNHVNIRVVERVCSQMWTDVRKELKW